MKTEEKKCLDCKEIKSLDLFGKRAGRSAHIKNSYCKKCMAERTRKYKLAHKEETKKYLKEYHQRKKAERLAQD